MYHVSNRSLILLILLAFVSGSIFSPFTKVYFSADDFYNMHLVFHGAWKDIFAAFLFSRREDFLFYRPLTTQFYFFVGQRLFDLHPIGYHLVSSLVFGTIIYSVFKLTLVLTKHERLSLFTTAFYALSASNFTRLAWTTQIQELLFAFSSLVTILAWIKYWQLRERKYYLFTLFFFLLALMSKETAVILPVLLVITSAMRLQQISILAFFKAFLLFLAILIIYSYLRFIIIGVSLGGNYFTSYSLKQIANTLAWYGLWAIGIPELFVNFSYFGKSGVINPKVIEYLLTDKIDILIRFGTFGLLLIFLTLFFFKGLLGKKKRSDPKYLLFVVFGLLWFVVALFPLLFSPFHKFPYELTLPLYGLSLVLATITLQGSGLLDKYQPSMTIFLPCLTIVLYLIANITAVNVEFDHNWVVGRGIVAHKVVEHFRRHFPVFPYERKVVLYNDIPTVNKILGVSRQLDYALSGSKAFQLIYNDNKVRLYFEDGGDIPLICASNTLLLASSSFFPL